MLTPLSHHAVMIDLDANATTRLLPEVWDAMLPWLRDQHANPSGSYRRAKQARSAIDRARGQVAELIGADESEILFTSGGTESVNTALHSLHELTARDKRALTTAIEHSAVLRWLDTADRQVSLLPISLSGQLILESLEDALPDASFVTVMTANNETGVIQPLEQVITKAREAGIPVHTDAVQAMGKIPVSLSRFPADLISLSAHKFHGPTGIGALYVRKGLRFEPLLRGGGQQQGRRSGTESTAAIVGMGMAAQLARQHLEQDQGDTLGAWRDRFEARILDQLEGVTVNGRDAPRLPNTSHLSFTDCDAAGLLVLLDEAGLQCSAGSACMTGKQQPSHVQLAMGINETTARSSLRFSFSRLNQEQDAMQAADAVVVAVNKLRGIQGSGTGPVVVYSP